MIRLLLALVFLASAASAETVVQAGTRPGETITLRLAEGSQHLYELEYVNAADVAGVGISENGAHTLTFGRITVRVQVIVGGVDVKHQETIVVRSISEGYSAEPIRAMVPDGQAVVLLIEPNMF